MIYKCWITVKVWFGRSGNSSFFFYYPTFLLLYKGIVMVSLGARRNLFLFLFLPRVRNKNSHYSEIRLPVAFLFLYYPFSTRSLGWTMVVNLELKRDSGVSHRLLKESPSLLYKSRGGCCNGTWLNTHSSLGWFRYFLGFFLYSQYNG